MLIFCSLWILGIHFDFFKNVALKIISHDDAGFWCIIDLGIRGKDPTLVQVMRR